MPKPLTIADRAATEKAHYEATELPYVRYGVGNGEQSPTTATYFDNFAEALIESERRLDLDITGFKVWETRNGLGFSDLWVWGHGFTSQAIQDYSNVIAALHELPICMGVVNDA